MNKTTRWYNYFIKPKTTNSLYNITIANSINGKTAVVRDCEYDNKLDQFTQVDDKTIFERQEIIEWQRQYLPNNKSKDDIK